MLDVKYPLYAPELYNNLSVNYKFFISECYIYNARSFYHFKVAVYEIQKNFIAVTSGNDLGSALKNIGP